MDARTLTSPRPRSPWREPTLLITIVAVAASALAFVGAVRASEPIAAPSPDPAIIATTTPAATQPSVEAVEDDPFAMDHGMDHGMDH